MTPALIAAVILSTPAYPSASRLAPLSQPFSPAPSGPPAILLTDEDEPRNREKRRKRGKGKRK